MTEQNILEIVRAAGNLSDSKTAALIIIERETKLDELYTAAAVINADVSASLIETAFLKTAPIYNDTIIINNDKIMAVCSLSAISFANDIPSEYDIKQRAALSITKQSDAVAIVVNEETGVISLASGDELIDDLTAKTLKDKLFEYLSKKASASFFSKIKLPSAKPSKGRWHLPIISIIISVALWVIIAYTENPSINITVKNIPVSYANLSELEDKGFTVVKGDRQPTVSAIIKGRRSDLFNVIRNVTASVDLSAINSSGSYEIPIDINIPLSSVSLVRKKVNNTHVLIEPVVTRVIPVNIEQVGTNKDYLVKSSADISQIAITGSKTAMQEVSAARVSVDISGIITDEASGYSYSFIDKNGDEIETNNVSSETTSIIITNEVYVAKTVPVELDVPDDFVVNVKAPEKLSVDIGVRAFSYDDITSVKALLPSSLTAEPDMTLSLHLNASPDIVYFPHGDYIEVKADIIKKTVKNITVPITVKNTPNRLSVAKIPETIEFAAKGPENLLDKSLMSAAADLSGLDKGVHRVKLAIEVPDGVEVETNYSVNVTLE